MNNQLTKIDYQVIHTNPGRIRISVPRLRDDLEYASKLQHLLDSLDFVTRVRINPLACSIAIRYDASIISSSRDREQIAACIQQAATTDSPIKKNTELAEAEVAPSRLASCALTVASKNVTVAFPKAYLKQSELAKRLGESFPELTHQRSKPEFTEWSKAKDPEGIGWTYDSTSNRFYEAIAQTKEIRHQSSSHGEKHEEELMGKIGLEVVGEVVGEAMGEILLGSIGAVVASKVMGQVGGLIGESLHRRIADVAGLLEHVSNQATEELNKAG